MSDKLYRRFAADLATGEGRTVYGLLAPTGVTSKVRDDPKRPAYNERFARGAFTRTVRERGHRIKLFVGHDTSRYPIGKATSLEERQDGLHGSFEIAATRDGDEALELIRTGFVDGFSVAFDAKRSARTSDGTFERREVALGEVSLVVEGAYEDAKVAGVRSAFGAPLSTEIARKRLRLALLAGGTDDDP